MDRGECNSRPCALLRGPTLSRRKRCVRRKRFVRGRIQITTKSRTSVFYLPTNSCQTHCAIEDILLFYSRLTKSAFSAIESKLATDRWALSSLSLAVSPLSSSESPTGIVSYKPPLWLSQNSCSSCNMAGSIRREVNDRIFTA